MHAWVGQHLQRELASSRPRPRRSLRSAAAGLDSLGTGYGWDAMYAGGPAAAAVMIRVSATARSLSCNLVLLGRQLQSGIYRLSPPVTDTVPRPIAPPPRPLLSLPDRCGREYLESATIMANGCPHRGCGHTRTVPGALIDPAERSICLVLNGRAKSFTKAAAGGLCVALQNSRKYRLYPCGRSRKEIADSAAHATTD